MKKLILTTSSILLFCFLQINFVYSDSHVTICTITSGIFDKTQSIDNGYCASAPDAYEVVAYELYLCTSEPTAPTTSSIMDLSSCFKNWESASGATLSVQQNVAIDVPGTLTRPPNGTYTHGVMLMDNTFGITWAGELSAAMTGMTGGTGVFCGTVAGSGTHAKAATSHTNSSVCGSSPITAGKFVETLAQFGSPSDDFDSKADAPNINGTTADIFGYLVDSNEHRAANTGEVEKLEGLVTFADSVVVTADTTSITMEFNVGEGMHLSESSGNKLFIGSGPFQAIMTAN